MNNDVNRAEINIILLVHPLRKHCTEFAYMAGASMHLLYTHTEKSPIAK
jgi:hypothetical protein